jgi:hypothetical protein
MSMHIDTSKPLTPAERAYLEERGNLAEIARIDSINGVTNPPEPGVGDGTGPAIVPLMTSEQRAAEKANLQKRLAEINAAEAEAAGDVEVVDEPYEAWKPAELDKELKTRSLPAGGSKGEKVARLYEDDEKQQAATAAQS